ncbi:MAG: DHA2 family efflux MFS transporter permease subunit [Xanthobacteraceae bacterium]|nr:DHA2 family efflux MFS transporter permease subunit [Xanthobacteraceae bacterium]
MRREILVPLIVATALFMENVDSSVIATSLPQISRDLSVDPIALKLALTSYLLSLAVFIPISGWMADKFGARTVFRAAIAVFTLGSIACGFAQGLPDLVLYRIVQGIGGAMMVPVGRLVILRLIPKHELVSALAWLVVPALIGPMIGPPLGGFITTYFHWRWIFWINIPIGIIGFILATKYIEDIREEKVPPLDVVGFILSGIGLTGLAFGFTTVGQELLPLWLSLGMIVVGAIVIYFYVRHARTHPAPLIDLKLFSVQTFRTSVVGGSLFRIGVGAMPFLLPLMFQLGFGLSPLQSGLLTFAGAAGAMLMRATVAPILRRFGIKRVLVVNTFIAASFIVAAGFFKPSTPYLLIIAVLFVGGFFRALQFSTLNSLAFADLGSSTMSQATSLTSVAQQISISAGVAVAAIVLESLRYMRGTQEILPVDFSIAFFAVAACSFTAILILYRLPIDAGTALIAPPPPEADNTERGPQA